MPRDSGRIYSGWLRGAETGIAEITIDGTTYSGQAVRSSSPEGFALTTMTSQGQYPQRSANAITVTDSGANIGVRALLRSADGRGLRCYFEGRNGSATGSCRDDAGAIYDVILTKRVDK